MSIDELLKTMLAAHEHYCQRLEDFVAQFIDRSTIKRPRFRIYLRGTNWAGKYNTRVHCCVLSLPFVYIGNGNEMHETIAHEACHAYQRLLGGKQWHGEMFKFLLQKVCGFPAAERCHHMSPRKAKQIARLLMLKLADNRQVQDLVYDKRKLLAEKS